MGLRAGGRSAGHWRVVCRASVPRLSVGRGYETMLLPGDWQRKAEWTFARLMYPPGPLDGYRGRFDGDWRERRCRCGRRDYPAADRKLAEAMKRLTRIDTKSVEQPVSLTTETRSTTTRGSTPCRSASGVYGCGVQEAGATISCVVAFSSPMIFMARRSRRTSR